MTALAHTFPTPLGPVHLACDVEGVRFPAAPVGRPLREGTATTWSLSGVVDVTLVVADVDFGFPDPIDGFVGAVWMVVAHASVGPTTITARLAADGRGGGFAPGEGLCAIEYARRGLALAMGTDDDDALARRVRGPRYVDSLPSQWGELMTPMDGPPTDFGTAIRGTALTVRLPPMPPRSRADIHVATAWGRDGDDAAPWNAVDRASPARILADALRDH